MGQLSRVPKSHFEFGLDQFPPPPSDSLFGHTDVCAGLREASVAVGMRGSGHGEEDGGGQGESPSDAGVHSL